MTARISLTMKTRGHRPRLQCFFMSFYNTLLFQEGSCVKYIGAVGVNGKGSE
jgi:hypothetical protein